MAFFRKLQEMDGLVKFKYIRKQGSEIYKVAETR